MAVTVLWLRFNTEIFCCFQIFDDAYKSQLSCVVVDDIERLLGESGGVSSQLCWLLQKY